MTVGALIIGVPASIPRVEALIAAPDAVVKFVSVEPQTEPLDLAPVLRASAAISWVIQGGESGPSARPFRVEWARRMRNVCADHGVAYYMKQLGAHALPHLAGDGPIREYRYAPSATRYELDLKDSHGGDMGEWPSDIRVREFPTPRVPS